MRFPLARENRSWGSDRIQGALQNLGYRISEQTVGNILQRRGTVPAPERRKETTWKEFIRAHQEVLAGTDFFTAEVWTCFGDGTASPLIEAQAVEVSVRDGVATLRGNVPSAAARVAATASAERGGATRVRNQLQVTVRER